MFRTILKLIVISIALHAISASAEGAYRLVGVARIYNTDLSASPKIELPVNPAFSSVLVARNDSFDLSYDGTSSSECSVKIKKSYPFDFNSAPLGSADKLNKFLEDKFHINSDGWKSTYLLQDASSSSCAALAFSRIYASNSELVLLSEPFIYIFDLESHPFRDASKSFDCGLAKTDVEHLICANPRLQKLDGSVNYGYVLMRRKYSKEISYQDPIRIDQAAWVLNVRNKCKTDDCLLNVYSSRINYIKGKVSDTYPSYPEEEND